MKRLIFMTVLVTSLLLCGCAVSKETPALTADQALDIALEYAGVSRTDIRDLENTLDRDHGKLVYEIDFDVGNNEYSYDVDANTGNISDVEHDRVD